MNEDSEATESVPRKMRTITLTNRAPVRIAEDEWPIIAIAEGDSWAATDPTLYRQAITRGECDTYKLIVRQHADGRAIVYGVLDAAIAAWRQAAGGESWRGGELLHRDDNIANAILRVGTRGGIPNRVIRTCIANLPAEEI